MDTSQQNAKSHQMRPRVRSNALNSGEGCHRRPKHLIPLAFLPFPKRGVHLKHLAQQDSYDRSTDRFRCACDLQSIQNRLQQAIQSCLPRLTRKWLSSRTFQQNPNGAPFFFSQRRPLIVLRQVQRPDPPPFFFLFASSCWCTDHCWASVRTWSLATFIPASVRSNFSASSRPLR